MKTSEILNLIADYMEKYGIGQSWFPEYGEAGCLEGAGKAVCRKAIDSPRWYNRWYDEIKPAISDYLTETRPEFGMGGKVFPWVWFDATEGSESIEVLRSLAVIEAAKEAEPAKVSA